MASLLATPATNVNFTTLESNKAISEAALSKAQVCCRLVAGIAGSNPAEGIDVCLLCLYVVLSCVGRGLCDGMITRPEESCSVSYCVTKNLNTEEDKAQRGL
jgi:hypothetical protein